MISRERLVDRFVELVQVDSGSLAEREIADVLKAKLQGLGLEVYEDGAGKEHGSDTGNLIGYLAGEGEPLLLTAHMDRVVPGKGIKPVVEGEVIRSSGDTILAADDLAGVAAILEVLEHLREENTRHRPLEIVLTIGEEVGLLGAKGLDAGRLKAKQGMALDSTGPVGQIVVGAPAGNELEVKFVGKPAHAGVEPEKGISAIRMAARAIEKMPLGRIDEETTANIGIIRGGEAVNIVTPETVIKGECRSHNPEKLQRQTRAMVEAVEAAAAEMGGKAEVKVTAMYPAFRLGEEDDIVKLVVAAARDLGLPVQLCISGGGSDANILNGMGIRTVNLAMGAEKVHTVDEYLVIAELENIARLLAAAVR